MTDKTMSVGRAIAVALDRVEEVRRRGGDRPVRVSILTGRSGLVIYARIAAYSPAEAEALRGLGTRCIPWWEIDARADEIADLVEDVAAEVTLAVASAARSPRPSWSQSDVELAEYNELVDELTESLPRAARAVLETRHTAEIIAEELISDAIMLAALKLAATSAFAAKVGFDILQDELRKAIGEMTRESGETLVHAPRPSLNS